jgi:hypothetical protein
VVATFFVAAFFVAAFFVAAFFTGASAADPVVLEVSSCSDMGCSLG